MMILVGVFVAILPCWRCGAEKDVLGEESRPAVVALRSVPLYSGHRQTHKDLRTIPECTG